MTAREPGDTFAASVQFRRYAIIVGRYLSSLRLPRFAALALLCSIAGTALVALVALGASPGGAVPISLSIPTAEYCVDANSFHFNVELADVPDSGGSDPGGVSVRFRIASDDFAFSGFDFQRIDVNFFSPSGVIDSAPEVSSFESARDRWQEGPISDFTVSSLGGGSWSIHGSVPNGTDPFVPGNKVFETVVRTSVLPDTGILSTPITACLPHTPTPMPTPSPTHTPTPSPTPTPTPTPSPPTPPPAGPFGSVDCNGVVDVVDALKIQRYIAGLPVQQQPGCPAIGTGSPFPLGDVDCDGDVDVVDALKIQRYVAGLPVQQQPGCPPIGSA